MTSKDIELIKEMLEIQDKLDEAIMKEYEDMIRDFLQSGLVVRCLPPKEDDF